MNINFYVKPKSAEVQSLFSDEYSEWVKSSSELNKSMTYLFKLIN